jgi:hypothetical protein
MPTPSIQRLQDALTDDLKKLGSEEVVNDSARKNFTTRVHGTILEFAHSQPDPAFWTGVKHYASGPRSRFRMRRTPMAPVAETKPAVKPSSRRKAQVA